MIARGVHLGVQLGDIDADQLAGALADLAGHHHGVDVGALDRLDDRADGVGHRENGDAIGADHDDVGLLARRERADLAFETGRAGAVHRRRLEHRFHRDRRGDIGLAAEAAVAHRRALLPEQGVHLAEQVAAESGVEVDAERRRQAVIDRLLIGEALVVEAEQRVRARIDGDVDAGLRQAASTSPAGTRVQ